MDDFKVNDEYCEILIINKYIGEKIREIKVNCVYDGYMFMEDFFFVVILYDFIE